MDIMVGDHIYEVQDHSHFWDKQEGMHHLVVSLMEDANGLDIAAKTDVYLDGKLHESGFKLVFKNFICFRVLVQDLDKLAAVDDSAVRWNGACKFCGKGTYTGFSTVEHEGVCAPKGKT